eukprot:8288602-Prorocentrum_lima.AAC.1
MLSDPSPADLLTRAVSVSTAILDVFELLALPANVGPEKTALLLFLRGAKADCSLRCLPVHDRHLTLPLPGG